MTHRAESIIQAVVAKVTGLTTTQARVFRGRSYPLGREELPGLLVYMGADEPQQILAQTLMDSLLTVRIESRTRSTVDQLDIDLNAIRSEIIIALQSDYTQGLAYVINTTEGRAEEPEFSTEGEQPSARQVMTWQILYRRSRMNPGA